MKPGLGRHWIEGSHREGIRLSLVPRSGEVGEASIGSNTPIIINPRIPITFHVVNQNSISPYLLTLKTLNMKGTRRNKVSHTGIGIFAEDGQNAIRFCIAITLSAGPRAYL